MEHFPLAICDFQTTFLKTRIKATEAKKSDLHSNLYLKKKKKKKKKRKKGAT
jgi:hypothetical protein